MDYCNEYGIVVQAFSPLGGGNWLNDATVLEIAEKLGKTPAQVLIRYALQKNWVPIAKSENQERIQQNADVFTFCIAEDDTARLDSLDRQEKPKFD